MYVDKKIVVPNDSTFFLPYQEIDIRQLNDHTFSVTLTGDNEKPQDCIRINV